VTITSKASNAVEKVSIANSRQTIAIKMGAKLSCIQCVGLIFDGETLVEVEIVLVVGVRAGCGIGCSAAER